LAQDGDRNGCALHGSVRLLEAIEGVVPILHASPGCGASAGLGTDAAANSCDGPVASVRELSATVLQEKQVVFGGTARLREQIKNTLKVHNGDLYVVVTGCVPEIVGDDTPAMVKEAREQHFPVIGVASPGFKGHAWTGYAQTARALLDQASLLPSSGDGPAPDVNLLGLVPGQDPGWEGDLLELEQLLSLLGLRANRLLGYGQQASDWHRATRARLTLVLSPWGAPAAQLLSERHGVPTLDLGWLPTGSRDVGILFDRVGQALGFDCVKVKAVGQALDARQRHFLAKASPALLLGDVQKRTAIVGGTASAVGQARFLANTLGQLVELIVITDQPLEERHTTIGETVRSVVGGDVDIAFMSGQAEIASQLRASKPELILGSALEQGVANSLEAAFLEIASPIHLRPFFLRGYGGVTGALSLVEDLLTTNQLPQRATPAILISPPLAQEQENLS
jgi:nitrogenase molybdenum-iron protein beta chain